MVGSELRACPQYLLDRAREHLSIDASLSPLGQKLASLFVRVFGIPEIGTQIRLDNVVRRLPAEVGCLLDVGTGAGMLLGEIRRRRHWKLLLGVDLDAESIRVARQVHPYATFRCEDIAVTSCELRQSFDYVICADVMEYVPAAELQSFVRACIAMLKGGGKLLIHVPNATQHRFLRRFESWQDPKALRPGFTKEQMIDLLRECGLFEINVYPSIGEFAALAWELNMLCAAIAPLQALVFPPLVLLARFGERLRCRRYNALLCVARH